MKNLLNDAPPVRKSAVIEVLLERERQNAKFPYKSHHAAVWLNILGEEVGESNQAVLHTMFGGRANGTLRTEMVQVAAVALAIVEALDEGRCWFNQPAENSQDNEQAPALPLDWPEGVDAARESQGYGPMKGGEHNA